MPGKKDLKEKASSEIKKHEKAAEKTIFLAEGLFTGFHFKQGHGRPNENFQGGNKWL
ncbi:hypothetical protein HNR65_003016 [Desulfosalsimonas propionicica]|uniref:Uncharacterized protein n=1 Tax=Desulfosalsimonas propionicica TaxID=332175 RepID=A0A7W0HLT7_9BACT|nr:hypothetical protein [Desulfosalsimonas propionicica]MBA2882662.1 hypothetical protein [Desulfosalsimonas propionicica]